MPVELQSWPRPHFAPGGSSPLLYYVAFGTFDLSRNRLAIGCVCVSGVVFGSRRARGLAPGGGSVMLRHRGATDDRGGMAGVRRPVGDAGVSHGQGERRKLRLLACATCRDHLLRSPYPEFAEVLTVAERYADGEATDRERAAAFATNVDQSLTEPDGAAWHYRSLVGFALGEFSGELGTHLRNRASGRSTWASPSSLRDLFGNPFRHRALDPEWLTSTVTAIARQMYDSRDFSSMPILADALQDAGCENDDILNHCRGPGPHVRGCWVVDLVLGKE